jgi:predicted  nucleic acid-binding Zn-ribbon protein
LADVPGGIDAWIARRAGVIDSPVLNADSPSGVSKGKQLREAEKDIARLERQVTKLNEKVLATEDYAAAGKLNKELLALRQALSEAEERWLSLSDS